MSASRRSPGLAARLPRKALLVALDLVRAAVALCLPFVDAVWQVYVLIFVLQAASAGFTPTFQATIPDILPDEDDYTNALSLSRLAYDLESLLAPLVAAALLTIVSFHALFAMTAMGFLASAALVLRASLPAIRQTAPRSLRDRTTRGLCIYFATPRLRGLMALGLAVAAGGSMVLVNTVVIVKGVFSLGETDVALALAAFGGGSMLAALTVPRLLRGLSDRSVMLAGGGLLTLGTALGALVSGMAALVPLWGLLGFGYGLVQTPGGRVLRRSAAPEDRPAVFAAQFAMSHSCWLLAYPMAGWLGPAIGLAPTFLVMALLAACGLMAALRLWPAHEPDEIVHTHPELAPGHPHLAAHRTALGHAHPLMIDDLHPRWPDTR